MRVLIFLTACLCCLQAVAADQAASDANAGAATAEACATCHNKMVSLKGSGTDTIAAQIRAIRAGDNSHPPGLDALSEEDIVIIAAYLDGAD